MDKQKKRIAAGSIVLLILALSLVAWNVWFSPTRIAFVNYQAISLGVISKANDNPFVKISELNDDNLRRIGNYDMVFINGMGWRITEEQRAAIQKAADKGLPVLTTMATNPANNILSIDSTDAAALKEYLHNGGRRNYRSLLNYVRRNIDKKIVSVNEPEEAIIAANEMIYHIDPDNPEDEELGFNSIAQYDAFLQRHGLLKAGAPRIVLTGQMGVPDDLIRKLEETGNVVYPVRNIRAFITQHHIDSVSPSALINMAHGRMGDLAADYLKRQNIPLFSPLNVNSLVEDWEADAMGMSGGFLSQSVVTPEIDGAIRPYALFGHYLKDGLQHAFAIPERLETFVQTVNNYANLQRKPNSEKRVAIVYYKGPGQSSLTASGMEVVPSLYNLLVRMKQEGYRIEGLPDSPKELERSIQEQGAVFGTYAQGDWEQFLKKGNPERIAKEQYESWIGQSIRDAKYAEVVKAHGEFPGAYMSTPSGELGIARLQLGNVVLLPQPAAGGGSDAFKIVHGTDQAPPHSYIAPYLWMQFGFKADAMIHFGTHGSLEFTPKKQVALSSNDWPDRLVGALPHFYVYSIGNVGEGVIAKRRAYAGLQSYLTPPFMESNLRGAYRELSESIKAYNTASGTEDDSKKQENPRREYRLRQAALAVKAATVKMGIHRELRLDSILSNPYSEEEILRIENFAEELATEKITGTFYTLGVPYEQDRVNSSVFAMSVDPIAYSLLALDKQRQRADEATLKHKALFTRRYLEPARELVGRLLANPALGTDELICRTANITPEELAKARETETSLQAPQDMMAMMMSMGQNAPSGKAKKPEETKPEKPGAHPHAAGHPAKEDENGKSKGKEQPHSNMPEAMRKKMKEMAKNLSPEQQMEMAKAMGASLEAMKKMNETIGAHSAEDTASKPREGGMAAMMAMMKKGKEYSREEKEFARAVMEIERAIKNVSNYKTALLDSPKAELESMINAMNGGYTAPSPGGDPIVNPNTLPTGRNLYAINAEATPSESAWEKGMQLTKNTIETYKKRHNDSIPRKISYTLWSGEFIETEGATIAQVLYALGVEPIRDAFGRVTDLRLIPSAELGRPRIDVVVQTSGQLRDIAASRLSLISRAVEMAAGSKDDPYENQVAGSAVEIEKQLVDQGITPRDARALSTQRVFGGINGMYGTGIQGMVASGDRWENESEIADTYINNMGAVYGSEKDWGAFNEGLLRAVLHHTDVVVQPRQSNTWGALSLDHVFEFMGGMNLAVRNVTGKDPDAYLADYRNRNNMRMQEVKEAIGVESRTTIFNPAYVKEMMKGGASNAAHITEIVSNTYGWNVMKPDAIDKEMWDGIYDMYVEDRQGLGTKEFFRKENPAALQEITAVMLETSRKGMWKPTPEQLNAIAGLHTDLVKEFGASGSGFSANNAKLQDYIAQNTSASSAQEYKKQLSKMKNGETDPTAPGNGMVLKKDTYAQAEEEASALNGLIIVSVVLVVFIGLLVLLKKKRNNNR